MSDDNTYPSLSAYRVVECSKCHEPALFGEMFADRTTDEKAWKCKNCTFGGMLEY
jgi:NAD-dependent SIR2 family protein deacetylase